MPLFLAGALALAMGTAVAFTQTSATTQTNVTAATNGTGANGSAFADTQAIADQAISSTSASDCGVTSNSTSVALAYTATATLPGSPAPTATPPTWQPVTGTAGTPGGGDLYCVAVAAGQSALVTVTMTNIGGLSKDYSYLNVPVGVYTCASGASVTCTTLAGAAVTSGTTAAGLATTTNDKVLTFINGQVTYSLVNPTGSVAYYEIALDAGAHGSASGSYFCLSTSTTSGASLAPQFYVQATAA